jgi:hypothetical protein
MNGLLKNNLLAVSGFCGNNPSLLGSKKSKKGLHVATSKDRPFKILPHIMGENLGYFIDRDRISGSIHS